MKIRILILTIIISSYCNFFCQTTTDSIVTKEIKVTGMADLEKVAFDFCDTFSVEISGLYPILNKEPELAIDTTIVKTLLIKNGFSQVDWGMGNWVKGPRFIYLKFKKANCTCETFKKYFYNQKQKDGFYNLRVTERLICNSDKFMDY